MKKESKWELFKEGASSPKTLIMASMFFTVGMFSGASLAAYNLFTKKTWGFAIFMLFLSLMQIVTFISQKKNYNVIVRMEKDIDDNQLNLQQALKEAH